VGRSAFEDPVQADQDDGRDGNQDELHDEPLSAADVDAATADASVTCTNLSLPLDTSNILLVIIL
jgi:hypothetical protein